MKLFMRESINRILLNFRLTDRFVTYEDKIKIRAPRYPNKILYGQDGNDLISEMLSHKKPLMITRIGGTELKCVRHFLRYRSNLSNKLKYTKHIKYTMSTLSGFFPSQDELMDDFSGLYINGLKNADIVGVWFNNYEDTICNRYCTNANLVELGTLESFRYKKPWSSNLAGKTVLVIHPFEESIKKQYSEKRQLLFLDPDVLPAFRLKTIKAVQSIADANVGHATWFDAYHYMCDEISNVEFDIAIIGAGAYGLPLASFVKDLGKQAVHLGGVTQILFGIKGRRWEAEYAGTMANLFNTHWIRPLPSEVPKGYDKVENGCYW